MTASPLPKNHVLRTAEDYAELRAQGMALVQKLTSAHWTDHNLHDPGITTLEALCYALTDLAYRSSFTTADLLTGQNGFIAEPELSGFFPAQQALTTTPLTLFDYRKLLLKIDGIRNAWMQPRRTAPASEIPVYVDSLEQQLTLDEFNSNGDDNAALHIEGLYDVYLELEPDAEMGSLNETALPLVLRPIPFKGHTGQLLLKDDTRINSKLWATAAIADASATVVLTFSNVTRRGAELTVKLNESDLPSLLIKLDTQLPASVTVNEWQALFSGSDALLQLFHAKQQRILELLEQAACALHDSRNLCEDYASIDTIAADYVAVCADIEVAPDADLEKVQAAVYFAIEQYLNPPVHYYSLSELQARGMDSNAIFDGPCIHYDLTHNGQPIFTKPGFVIDEDLEASVLRKVVHASDIINVLMDIPDVLNVKSLLLRKYKADGTPVGGSEKWCLPIGSGHQPVLLIPRSKILFLKQGIPFLARRAEFEATLRHLRAAAIKQAYAGIEEALTVPAGRRRDTLTHYPVQHDFPMTYQIGVAGIEANATLTRIMQARQFKAYLLFFEQVLADYLAQLAHLPELFSLNKTLQQSYFSQYLTNIQPTLGPTFEDEFYLDKTLFADETLRNRLREDRESSQRRRNRLLDHLLARFAEQFTDYVMLMIQQEGDSLKTYEALINDKIDFLRQQPVLSRERNRAFNYKPENPALIWDTDNVSGLEKRAARLAGIDDYRRRNLSCALFIATLISTRKVGSEFRIEIKDAEQNVLFKSKETFATRELAEENAEAIFDGINNSGSYHIDTSGGPGAVFYSITYNGITLTHDDTFDNHNAAVNAIETLVARYYQVLEGEVCNGEGFYLIEHLLLRPRTLLADLPDVCVGDEAGCGDEDWFSFRASVVLPYWPVRFQSIAFRQFFERLVREQAPAHVLLKVCWIDHEQMVELELALHEWLERLATEPFDSTLLTTAQNAVLTILQRLRSKYPTATLHDCDDDDSGEPVRLGSTNLGGF